VIDAAKEIQEMKQPFWCARRQRRVVCRTNAGQFYGRGMKSEQRDIQNVIIRQKREP
jgi:hypothetical protein